ncbi:MAG: outer membrane protein assembly factor BamA, partial [Myxococcota bacterium]|nr:outer membrane protein assembly factor BamA [Myxococcota bacterium]
MRPNLHCLGIRLSTALLCFVLFPLFGPGTSHAAKAELSESVLAKISVEGLKRVQEDAALRGVRLKLGDVVSRESTRMLLGDVWDTGFFKDVRIEQELKDDGVHLYVVVKEKPSVKTVKYEGYKELSKEDIKGVVDVKPFTILNAKLLKQNATKIRNLAVEKGYFLADVDFKVETNKEGDDWVDVVFVIHENDKVMVRQITFIGNENLSDDELKNSIQTREGGVLSWFTQAGTYNEEFFQADIYRLQALYYDQGFVTVNIAQPRASISSDRRHIYLTIEITEGERYRIGDIGFSGDVELRDDASEMIVDEKRLRKKLSVEAEEYFNRTKLFGDIQKITSVYQDQGYAYANVTPNSRIDKENNRVHLDLNIDRGNLVYFGRIEVLGNTRTRDKVIRREMRVVEGDKYNASKLNASRARIFQLGYFENVNVTTERGNAEDVVDVKVEVSEKSTGTFQIGAGFSSVENFIATAQISQNNFLGRGQLLSVSAQLSFGEFGRQLAYLQFQEPYFYDTLWSFGFNAYITQRYYRDFQRNAKGFSPSFGYPITPDLRLNGGYTLEEIQISTDLQANNSGPALYNLNRGGLNSAVNMNLSYDTRDNRLFPTKGQYHVLSAEVSDAAIMADAEMAYRRFRLSMRYYHPIVWDFVLKLNSSFGLIYGGDYGVPISERFFPGGIFSVRGFEPRGLGPTMPVLNKNDPYGPTSDFTVGGNKEAIFNLEIEFPILAAAGIKGVLF